MAVRRSSSKQKSPDVSIKVLDALSQVSNAITSDLYLEDILRRIDGRGYPAYKDIRGHYACRGYDLFIDHVQGDPFAAPSRLRVRVPL